MENQGRNICAKCGRRVDELLIMICHHHLCLPCAGHNTIDGEQGQKCVVCDVCGSKTQLEAATAAELEQSLSEIQLEPSPTLSAPPVFKQMDVGDKYCAQHPDEQVKYFCFDCEAVCVCSECVIYGIHKGHDVLTIKRAYPIVRSKVEDMQIHLNVNLEGWDSQLQVINDKSKKVENDVDEAKQQIDRQFFELTEALNRKERELTQKLQNFQQEQLAQIENHDRVLQGKLRNVSEGINLLQTQKRSNDKIEMMNFYAKNQEKVILQGDIEVPLSTENISSLHCYLDPQAITSNLEEFKILHFKIAELKGPQQISYDDELSSIY